MNLYGYADGDPINYHDPFGLCPESMGGDGKSSALSDCPAGSKGARFHALMERSQQSADATTIADPQSRNAASGRASCMQKNLIEGAQAGAAVATTGVVLSAAVRANRMMNAFGVAGAVTFGSIGGPALAPAGFYAGRILGLGASLLPVLLKEQLVPINQGTAVGIAAGGVAGAALCSN